eukprot:4946535-Ditylum_brightwellii.AAC.1
MWHLHLNLDNLQKFAVKLGIAGERHMTKQQVCQAIVLAKLLNDVEVANRTAEGVDSVLILPI